MLAIYLHGFASSPQSTKALYFAAKLRERGIDLLTPDFNEPDFSTLTITRMIDQVASLMNGRRGSSVTLIGSSLGGFVAVQTALKGVWDAFISKLDLTSNTIVYSTYLGGSGNEEFLIGARLAP